MSYTITQDVITKEVTQRWIDPGVHSDIDLTHRVDVSTKGNIYFVYTYTNSAGQTVNRTEWEVDELGPYENLPEGTRNTIDKMAEDRKISKPEAIQLFRENKVKAQMRRIIYVAKLFVPEEELTGKQFDSFEAFVKYVDNAIGKRNEGVKLRVKFTFDRKGWVNTPDYVRENTPWIERVDEVPEEKSKIKIVDGLDKIVRPAPNGYRAPKKENPLEEDVAPAKVEMPADKDLPF